MEHSKTNYLEVRTLKEDDIDLIMQFQEQIINGLDNKDFLRRNTKEMFESCLVPPNFTLGVFDGDKLVAMGIGVDAIGTEEDLSVGLKSHTVQRSFNYKSTMVDKPYRGLGLQRMLIGMIEKYARFKGYTDLCATVSDENLHSLENMIACGFKKDHEAIKYGALKRVVMCKKIDPTGTDNKDPMKILLPGKQIEFFDAKGKETIKILLSGRKLLLASS